MYQVTYYFPILVAHVISNFPDNVTSYTSFSARYRILFISLYSLARIIPVFYQGWYNISIVLHFCISDIVYPRLSSNLRCYCHFIFAKVLSGKKKRLIIGRIEISKKHSVYFHAVKKYRSGLKCRRRLVCITENILYFLILSSILRYFTLFVTKFRSFFLTDCLTFSPSLRSTDAFQFRFIKKVTAMCVQGQWCHAHIGWITLYIISLSYLLSRGKALFTRRGE